MIITTGPLTDWVLEFYTAPRVEATQIEMGISMRLLSPGGDVYFISCRDGRNIEIRHDTRPVNPTPTWTAEEFDRVMTQASTTAVSYPNVSVDWTVPMHPTIAREVFRHLENDLATPSDEDALIRSSRSARPSQLEVSCL